LHFSSSGRLTSLHGRHAHSSRGSATRIAHQHLQHVAPQSTTHLLKHRMSRLEGFVDGLRCFPNEFQRELQLIGALDIRATKLAHAAERLQNSLLQRASNPSGASAHTPSYNEANAKKSQQVRPSAEGSIEQGLFLLRRMHQDLLNLHDEKRQITIKVKEMVSNTWQQLQCAQER
jgi:hypothetical protein